MSEAIALFVVLALAALLVLAKASSRLRGPGARRSRVDAGGGSFAEGRTGRRGHDHVGDADGGDGGGDGGGGGGGD